MIKEIEQFFPDKIIPMSNVFISSKGRTGLMEEKINTLCLSELENAEVIDGNYHVTLSAATIKMALKIPKEDRNIYGKLKKAATCMMGTVIGYVDDVAKEFTYAAPYIFSQYKNGKFLVVYNGMCKKELFDLNSSFTRLSRKILLSLDNIFALKLYRLLKSACFVKKFEKERSLFQVGYSLNELKFALGVLDAGSPKVQQILKSTANPDYDVAYKVLSIAERHYDEWDKFKEKVLDKAVEEINSRTDIEVSYIASSNGEGKRIDYVYFNIHLRSGCDLLKNNTEFSAEDKQAIIDEVGEIITEKLKVSEYTSIAEAAEYDIERVRNAYKCLQTYSGNVESVVAFLIASIKNGYCEPVKRDAKVNKSGYNSKNAFTAFQQNDYDFEQLELQLVLTEENISPIEEC